MLGEIEGHDEQRGEGDAGHEGGDALPTREEGQSHETTDGRYANGEAFAHVEGAALEQGLEPEGVDGSAEEEKVEGDVGKGADAHGGQEENCEGHVDHLQLEDEVPKQILGTVLLEKAD